MPWLSSTFIFRFVDGIDAWMGMNAKIPDWLLSYWNAPERATNLVAPLEEDNIQGGPQALGVGTDRGSTR